MDTDSCDKTHFVVTAINGRAYYIPPEGINTVMDLKVSFSKLFKYEPGFLEFIYDQQKLLDDELLTSHGITVGKTVYVVLNLKAKKKADSKTD